ncbi:uncharacterized protein [Miscanthus floridulus]|uniref:uncharacterized protein n=1 Tax=Miscanthus floridulus TaxID=154761 RepID=UPI00345AC776
MATTAAGYGCCAAGLPPSALLPGILSSRREPPPPHLSLVASSSKFSAPAPRLRVSYHPRRLASSSREVNSDVVPSPTEAAVDIKLPRRSLLVQFTCNACGERTKRLINRVAYESGTVFLQCAGCQVYHKFVDNLGLVVEYDLREENELQGENVVNPNSED